MQIGCAIFSFSINFCNMKMQYFSAILNSYYYYSCRLSSKILHILFRSRYFMQKLWNLQKNAENLHAEGIICSKCSFVTKKNFWHSEYSSTFHYSNACSLNLQTFLENFRGLTNLTHPTWSHVCATFVRKRHLPDGFRIDWRKSCVRRKMNKSDAPRGVDMKILPRKMRVCHFLVFFFLSRFLMGNTQKWYFSPPNSMAFKDRLL